MSAVWAGRLIHELGMYDDFALWIWAHSPTRNRAVRDLQPECVVVAEPTNLCIQMREAATEGYLSESHPLVQAAIATYETLYELPPIVSQPAAPLAPMGFPAIAFGAGDDGGIRHLLKAVQFYAAFPTTYVETTGRDRLQAGFSRRWASAHRCVTWAELLILRGDALHPIDHQHLDPAPRRFQFQPELLFERGEQRRTGGCPDCMLSGVQSRVKS